MFITTWLTAGDSSRVSGDNISAAALLCSEFSFMLIIRTSASPLHIVCILCIPARIGEECFNLWWIALSNSVKFKLKTQRIKEWTAWWIHFTALTLILGKKKKNLPTLLFTVIKTFSAREALVFVCACIKGMGLWGAFILGFLSEWECKHGPLPNCFNPITSSAVALKSQSSSLNQVTLKITSWES